MHKHDTTNGTHPTRSTSDNGHQAAIALPGIPNLAPHHYQMLAEESGIPHEFIVARGYWTATKKRDLEDLGFAPAQRRVPALVLPIHGVGGIVVNHQIRPDTPRRGRDGHVVKYETPFDSRMMLDVPPCVRHHLDNPQVPLFVTEGLKKGDALAGRSTEEVPFGVVPLVGVWNWRGTNEHGGKAPVPCWYSVALNDRLVYIVFDGDVMVKRQVWYALAALKPFLASRGAKIRLVYLPQTLDGQKCGVDDYLVAGHTIQDLRELSTTKLLPPPPLLDVPVSPRVPYAATEHGLVMHRHTPNGVFTVPLANFAATIVTDLIEDDGVERTRTFEIEVTLQQQTTRLMVPAASFAHLTWVTAQLGAGAIIAPGNTMKDHCRAAIQTLSTALTTRTVYTHCGWRQIGEAWCYLHGAGAIGPQEVVANIDVSLGETMARYRLPVPPRVGGERQAIRASLGLLDVAADAVAMPLLMTVWRAVLGAADFALSLVGPTGTGKSELAALAQQHFGAGMDARHLPGAWSSTANALGELLFLAKDALLTIDDYCPTGSQADQQRLHRDADRIFRSQGNTAGRQRMRPQGGLHPERPPRGLILATGEDVPSGQSLRARLLTLEINARTVNWRALSQCQQHAAEGRYAAAMAGFVSWLTSHYDQIRTAWPHVVTELRRQVQDHGHKRHSTITAELQCAWHLFLDYAIQVNAITEEEAVAYRRRSREALTTVAEAQAAYQRDDDPVDRFFGLLHALLTSGGAHLADRDTNHIPSHTPDHYGWQRVGKAPAARLPEAAPYDPGEAHTAWQPQGPRLGWLDETCLYLSPEPTYTALVELARRQAQELGLNARALWKRLHEQNVLVRDPKRREYTVRISVNKQREYVLQISLETYGLKSRPSRPSRPGDDNRHNNNELQNENVGDSEKYQNSESPKSPTRGLTEDGFEKDLGDLGDSDFHRSCESPKNSELKNPINQYDRSAWATWATWATFRNPICVEETQNARSVGPQDACPQCRARRSQATGAYRRCLACGHKWQVAEQAED